MVLNRRDVILASVAAFISWGFITHWLPLVRFVPYAFLAGLATAIILLLWGILFNARPAEDARGPNPYGARLPAFVPPQSWKAETKSLGARSYYRRKPLYSASFVISEALDGLLELILRDYVNSWYKNISGRPTFANEVDRAIRAALGNIRDRLLGQDLVEVLVSRMIPIITTHMKDFYESERQIRGKLLTRNITESDGLDLAIAGKYKDGRLHPAASLAFSDTKLSQQQYLRGIVARLVTQVLPQNMTSSRVVVTLIKELVACAVLFPVMQMLADADTWNQILATYGTAMLNDRKSVRRLRAALDEHAPPSPSLRKMSPFPKIMPNDNERKFERFIRAIRKCNNLSEARRFRSEVASQLRREGEVKSQNLIYVRRLEAGKRLLDQRVAHLGAGITTRPKLSVKAQDQSSRAASRFEKASLRDVLYDASGLSYFMEYMDRVGLMRLVQFWIVVDGIRNPLEGDNDDPAEFIQQASAWDPSDRTDVAQIHEAYLSRPEIQVAAEAQSAVTTFLKAGDHATPLQYSDARRAILKTQTKVFQEMKEPHFESFRKSDLYFKWLASDEASMHQNQPGGHAGLSTNQSLPPTTSTKKTLKLPRVNSKTGDLRRAVASHTDLKSAASIADTSSPPRRSFDDMSPRRPLFDDDLDNDPLAQSTNSLDSDRDSVRQEPDNTKAVDAMEEALNNILDNGPEKDSLFSDRDPRVSIDSTSRRSSFGSNQPLPFDPSRDKEKPSLASLGLVGAPNRRGVFSEDALFGEEEKFLEDEREDEEHGQDKDEDVIHEAAPGDLGLAEAIDTITMDVEKLVSQESIVDSLTKKAELTNNAAELRILKKSKASLQREIHRKELQRQQYIVQESDNSLFGRATINIKSIMVGNEEDGREFALYVIEVRRQAGDQMPAAVWAIARRYSEFHELNKRLRARYPVVRNLDFPRRQVVLKLQKDFLEKRKLALERYLNGLLQIPAICRSRELRAFLSQQAISANGGTGSEVDTKDFVTRIYNSVTDGMEEFLGNIPVLDQLSLAGQNIISAATTQMGATATTTTSPLANDFTAAAEAEAELEAFDSRELEPFVKPICDLFLEVFELNKGNNWLRGRAVVVVLHQLLGGTIERKVRDNAKLYLEEDSVARYINMVKDIMWPGGKMKQQPVSRPDSDRAKSRKEAGVLLATLIPDMAGSVVGRANAQAASRRIFAVMNNHRLK
ncbi:MAG: Intermediate filament protein [Bathelium mastoideum]|nr:MAG: Intermediate filament protein [Bathelium mastoideum]